MDRLLPTIVVVDDSAEVRALVSARLRLSGSLEVVGDGANGMEAIGLAYHHQPSLVLLDLSMPGMDGLEALAGILAVSPTTRVVVYSGFEERGIAQTARELGAAGFIEKSLPIEQLTGQVLAALPEHWAQMLAGADDRSPGRRGPLSLVDVNDEPLSAAAQTLTREDDQRALDEHLESFREVFDEAAIGMATMTLSGTVVRANRALAELMRCKPDDLVGVDYGRLTCGRADLLDAALDDISHEISDLAVIDHEVSGWPTVCKARASLAAVRDSKGHSLYVFLQVQDITAQAAAEQQLRHSEERFRLLIEAVQEYAIFMLDTDGTVASWNSGAQRIKGYSAREILGSHFRVFYPAEQQAAGHPEFELEEALRHGRYEEEGWRIRKDGTRFWANVLITAVFDESGTHIGFAKVTRDTTERRRFEEDRAASTTALETANVELESLADRLRQSAEDQQKFLAMTAHELRSPLTVLGGSADTLALHWSDLSDADRRGLLDGMSVSAKGLQRLLADLLAASRLDANTLAVEPAPVRLDDVLHLVADAIRASQPTAAISVSVADGLQVVADPFRLGQAVDNLVRNALSHGEPPVRITAESVDGAALIRVTDGGLGVDPSVAPRLFEKFATGDLVDGTGLGLFISRELARAQGGDAAYEEQTAEHPAGSFVLTIPLAE
jgi:PAS domain S-box-containing protein